MLKTINNFWKYKIDNSYRLTLVILFAIILGIISGLFLGESAKILLPLGKIFNNLIFTFVTPLIFFSISSTIANVISLNSIKRLLITSICVFLFMSFIATIFMILSIKIFPINNIMFADFSNFIKDTSTIVTGDFADLFTAKDFSSLLSKTSILPLIIFSMLFGIATKLIGSKGDSVRRALNNYNLVMFKMLDFLMYYAPVGLFAYFAYFTGNMSKDFLYSINSIIVKFYIIAILFAIIFYSLLAYFSAGKDGIKSLKFLVNPLSVAIATESSLATLPINFKAAHNINIPKNVSNISLSLGSIIHLDGSSLSVVLKVMLACALFNVEPTGIMFYSKLILMSVFVCFLMSGVPGSGPILDITIIHLFKLPIESLPILIGLYVFIDPIVTILNACGNIVGSMVISRFIKGKYWNLRKDFEEDPVLGIYK